MLQISGYCHVSVLLIQNGTQSASEIISQQFEIAQSGERKRTATAGSVESEHTGCTKQVSESCCVGHGSNKSCNRAVGWLGSTGLRVIHKRSGKGRVVLRPVTSDLTAKYQCVVNTSLRQPATGECGNLHNYVHTNRPVEGLSDNAHQDCTKTVSGSLCKVMDFGIIR
jgi:hypothetical protein